MNQSDADKLVEMQWLDERIAEQQQLRTRESSILNGADTVYEALWGRVADTVAAAMRKSVPAYTNGAGYDRIVRRGNPHNAPGAQPELHIRLFKGTITATGPEISLTFHLDVCSDGVVCLKLDGEQISIPHAVIRMLDPFLFPELPPK